MSIDKTIRIEQLPVLEITDPSNLFVVNDANNITKSLSFDKLISGISELPSLNLPPSGPGDPNLTFCPEDNPECKTGIGAQGCEIYITVCGDDVVTINQGGVVIDGALEIKNDAIINGNNEVAGDLIVDGDGFINGDLTIGKNCATRFDVNSKSKFNCDVEFAQIVQIGEAGTFCDPSSYLSVSGESTFNCGVTIFGETDIKKQLTVEADTRLEQNVYIGTNCGSNYKLKVLSKSEFMCDAEFNENSLFKKEINLLATSSIRIDSLQPISN